MDVASLSTIPDGSDVAVGSERASGDFVETLRMLWAPIALAALILGVVLLGALRRRSKRETDPEPAAPDPTGEDMAVVAPLVAADIHAGEGDWTRDMLTLDPPGAIDGIVADSGRLVGFGQAAGADGDAARAAVWQSSDGISWQSVALLGPGVARLAVPWREGLLVAAVHELDERLDTTCWWVDGAGIASEEPLGGGPLRGVVEGGTATDDVAVLWGRGSRGPRVWVAEDGAMWRESDLQRSVDLVASSGSSFVAFGRGRTARPSVAHSTDGISWEASNVDDPMVFEGAWMVAAVPFEGRLVAAGTDIMRDAAATWTTEDGQCWHRTVLPSVGSAHVVNLVVAKIVAVWESRDAVSWRSVAIPKLFADSSAKAMAVVGDSIVVSGTLQVERDEGQFESVPVTWRSRVLGSGGPLAQEPASLSATEEPEPMPAR
jgi:hypothetical protein